MAGFDVTLFSDITDRIKTWEEQYVSETSYSQYLRAGAFVMDTAAARLAVTSTSRRSWTTGRRSSPPTR